MACQGRVAHRPGAALSRPSGRDETRETQQSDPRGSAQAAQSAGRGSRQGCGSGQIRGSCRRRAGELTRACAGSSDVADRICVAQIGPAHGIRGEVKLKSFTAEPMAVKDYGPLESEDGTRSFAIETLRPAKGHLVARLAGIEDRNAAEALARVRLFVPRDRLPAPAADEFYHIDLVGLLAVTAAGEEVGTVAAVHDFGAGDI